jgi:hypothetical protein
MIFENNTLSNNSDTVVLWTWKRLNEVTELRVSPSILPEYLCWITTQLEYWKN